MKEQPEKEFEEKQADKTGWRGYRHSFVLIYSLKDTICVKENTSVFQESTRIGRSWSVCVAMHTCPHLCSIICGTFRGQS